MASRLGNSIAKMIFVGLLLAALPLLAQSPPANYPPRNNPPSNTAQPQAGGLRQPNDGTWQNQGQPLSGNPAGQANPQAQVSPGLQQPGLQQPGQVRAANPAGAQPAGNAMPFQIQAGPLPAPFALSPQQQSDLDKLLSDWEAASSKVDLFYCGVAKLEYDSTFGGPEGMRTVSEGELKYKAPDKGLFHLTKSSDYIQDPKSKEWKLTPTNAEEYWTCDGKSTFQVDQKQKLVIESPIPPEMQGKSITDGPLPFVFGAKADVLRKRYYLRITQVNATQVWLEAFPKMQKDAANFAWVEIILTKNDKLPVAIQIYNPGCDPKVEHKKQSRTMISFTNPSVNSAWAQLGQMLNDFSRPSPFGYKHVLAPIPGQSPPATPAGIGGTPQITGAPAAGSDQATRPKQAAQQPTRRE